MVFNALQKDRFYSYNWIGQFWHNREIEKHIFRQIFLEIRSIKVSRLLDLIKTCQPEKGDVKDWANVTGNIFALSLCFLILKLYIFLHTILRLMDIMISWKWKEEFSGKTHYKAFTFTIAAKRNIEAYVMTSTRLILYHKKATQKGIYKMLLSLF